MVRIQIDEPRRGVRRFCAFEREYIELYRSPFETPFHGENEREIILSGGKSTWMACYAPGTNITITPILSPEAVEEFERERILAKHILVDLIFSAEP